MRWYSTDSLRKIEVVLKFLSLLILPLFELRRNNSKFLELLNEPRCFYRDCFPAHITGSALLLSADGDKVLMNHHKSLNMWMQFGGHADGDEDILAVAIRETMEESGIIAFKPITPNIVDLDIHEIPANVKKNETDKKFKTIGIRQVNDSNPGADKDTR